MDVPPLCAGPDYNAKTPMYIYLGP